jgi:RNA polymerase sigma-70 factor (ECF subfamily)
MTDDLAVFESQRPELLALAYRMLGDMGRAEDMVQEAWLRWEGKDVEVDAPRAYLLKVVTHLCLNDLDSARARREEGRGDRLPEPVDVHGGPLGSLEALDRISMAFLVVLQRLTPAERAVLLLHDVFDFSHSEIAAALAKSESACRQLHRRAKENVAAERRVLVASPEEHRRLLRAFVRAAGQGSAEELVELLASDAVLIADGGPGGSRFGRVRSLPRPIAGATKVAAFCAAVTPQGSVNLEVRECELNGQPAVLVLRDGLPYTAILLGIAGGKIRYVFIHADAARLGHVGRGG